MQCVDVRVAGRVAVRVTMRYLASQCIAVRCSEFLLCCRNRSSINRDLGFYVRACVCVRVFVCVCVFVCVRVCVCV